MIDKWIITESKQNGIDVRLLNGLIQKRNLLLPESYKIITQDQINPESSGGLEDVKSYLKKFIHLAVEITRQEIEKVLIIVDADERPSNRFAEMKNLLNDKAFSLPDEVFKISEIKGSKIRTGIYLHPNSKHKGSLESIIWNCFKAIPELTNKTNLVEGYIESMISLDSRLASATENNRTKIKLKVLSDTLYPNQYTKIFGNIDYTSSSFDKLSEFISQFA